MWLAIGSALPARVRACANGQRSGIAGSFDQRRLLVRPGDAVSVTDNSGREVSGRIAELTPATLTVVVRGNSREWTEKDVRKIRHRRSDPLSNGALWGAWASERRPPPLCRGDL
jgi:hypothetical protein